MEVAIMSIKDRDEIQYKSTYITVQEFAKTVGMSAATLRNWCDTGKFKPSLILESGRRMYHIDQIQEFKNQFSPKHPKIENDEVFAVYTTQDKNRLNDVYNTIVKYFSDIGRKEFLDSKNPRIQIFHDTPYNKGKTNKWVGCEALGKYVKTNKTVGILIALNPDEPKELDMIRVVKTLASVLDIQTAYIYDKVNREKVERVGK